jgi:phytoene/squalene synthetase
MRHYQYSVDDLKSHTRNDNFLRLMQFYAARAETCYQKAFEEFSLDRDNKLLAAKAMASIYRALLKKIQRKNFPVLKRRVSLCLWEKTRAVGPCLFTRWFSDGKHTLSFVRRGAGER